MLVRVNANKTAKAVPSQLNELARQDAFWSELKYPGDSKLFAEAEAADYVYLVREGAVRTYKRLSDGRRQISAFHLPGDIFGAEDGEVHRFTAEAIVNTTVWIAMRRSLFATLAKADIPAANNVRDMVARALEHAENHLLLLGRQKSLEKVAAFLLEIDRRLEQPEVIVLPMGRLDIADYLGLTVESVSRALSSLQEERIFSFRGSAHREIVLHDRSRLAQRATVSAQGVATRRNSQREGARCL
jgi:CRP/FNR family nitrogen fixation transcriptional regulator